MTDNEKRFERLRLFRSIDEKGYYLMVLSVEWDSLNSIFEKSGISEDFIHTRTRLKGRIKSLIERGAIEQSDVERLSKEHPTYFSKQKNKIIHGYNFRY